MLMLMMIMIITQTHSCVQSVGESILLLLVVVLVLVIYTTKSLSHWSTYLICQYIPLDNKLMGIFINSSVIKMYLNWKSHILVSFHRFSMVNIMFTFLYIYVHWCCTSSFTQCSCLSPFNSLFRSLSVCSTVSDGHRSNELRLSLMLDLTCAWPQI